MAVADRDEATRRNPADSLPARASSGGGTAAMIRLIQLSSFGAGEDA